MPETQKPVFKALPHPSTVFAGIAEFEHEAPKASHHELAPNGLAITSPVAVIRGPGCSLRFCVR